MTSQKCFLPEDLQCELQRTIAVVCYNIAANEGVVDKKEMEDQIYQLFFGDWHSRHNSQVDQFFACTPIYKNLFTKELRPCDTHDGEPTEELVLNTTFSRRANASYVLGMHINRTNLSYASPKNHVSISGHGLNFEATVAIDNCRKAMVHAEKWYEETSHCPLLTNFGDGYSNIYEYVLEQMYRELVVNVTLKYPGYNIHDIEKRLEEEGIDSIRNVTWLFPGYFVFVLYTEYKKYAGDGLSIFEIVAGKKCRRGQAISWDATSATDDKSIDQESNIEEDGPQNKKKKTM